MPVPISDYGEVPVPISDYGEVYVPIADIWKGVYYDIRCTERCLFLYETYGEVSVPV